MTRHLKVHQSIADENNHKSGLRYPINHHFGVRHFLKKRKKDLIGSYVLYIVHILYKTRKAAPGEVNPYTVYSSQVFCVTSAEY